MFLKCLDMYGFKSFADKTHIDFAEGITTLLGPNGCGKSNIVDAIKWVLGEQGTKTLRASKMEDVIFNGNDKRKPMPFAEVALTIDNSNGQLKHPAAEIEIKRRIFRSGSTEYYLNRERCLLKEIKELLMDTGVGKSAYSVLEQGKIDQIISMRPEDRRYIFEEAAGISKFKQQCAEAQNKILKSEENISKAEDLVAQYRRTYNRTKDQAEKCRKYKDLQKRSVILDAQLNACKVKSFITVKQLRQENIAKMEIQIEEATKKLENYDDDLSEQNERFRLKSEDVNRLRLKSTEISGQINTAYSSVTFLQDRLSEASADEKAYKEKAQGLKNQVDVLNSQFEELKDKIDDDRERLGEVVKQISTANRMVAEASATLAGNEAEIFKREDRNAELDKELERLSLELKSVIENLINEVDEKTSSEFSLKRKEDAENSFLSKVRLLKAEIDEDISRLDSGSGGAGKMLSSLRIGLDELIALFNSYRDSIPPVVDTLLSPEGLVSKKRDIETGEQRARNEIESNRSFISSAREMNLKLREEIDSLKETVKNISLQEAGIRASIANNEAMMNSLRSQVEEKKYDLQDALDKADLARTKVVRASSELKEKDEEIARLRKELEESNANVDRMAAELQSEAVALQKMRNDKDNLNSSILQSRGDLEKEKLYISNADEMIKNLYESFYNKYNRNLGEYKEYFEQDLNQQLVENELREVNKELEGAGNINYMAEDEFVDAKNSLDFYTKHLEDEYKAKADLVKVFEEIQTKSVEMFLKTYKDISANFQKMFTRLFGGGTAEVSLQDENEVLTTGIDIFAQPPGKKPTNMSLLSGGERSMTAVALLFATYMVKPSPFCILDEIDAALDDRNIGFFISVLEDFGKTSQFIIITHNKHTVTASESLLGVTQMEAGVSTTVSYKIASVKGEPVILDEHEKAVEID